MAGSTCVFCMYQTDVIKAYNDLTQKKGYNTRHFYYSLHTVPFKQKNKYSSLVCCRWHDESEAISSCHSSFCYRCLKIKDRKKIGNFFVIKMLGNVEKWKYLLSVLFHTETSSQNNVKYWPQNI